ncbi:hypothetical protein [Streptomyces canus]|uniref:hypothetical protein n=1 Tax=Streptomyces canus TaxID=58343 RepID=UPI0033ADB614
MTYFNLRKRAAQEPDEAVDEELAEDEEPEDEEDRPVGLGGALWAGISGPGRWLSDRDRAGLAWVLYVGSVWAAGFYGGWVAVGVIAAWVAAVLLFMPRDAKDRAAAWVERRVSTKAGQETAEKDPVHALVAVMWKLIADAPGVHLKTLAEHLQAAAPGEVVDRAAVRAKLGALNIPVRVSVRDAARRVNEGVHREDLEAWERALPDPSSAPAPEAGSGPVATAVTCDVADVPTPVATPLSRLRGLLSRGAA